VLQLALTSDIQIQKTHVDTGADAVYSECHCMLNLEKSS